MSDVVGYIAMDILHLKQGDPVYVDWDNAGTVMMKTSDKCCKFREEYNKLPLSIKKKIIATMRMAGSQIKVNFNE